MQLSLPQATLRTRPSADGGIEVYDPLRRRYVAMTPEELVRQHFTAWLTGELGYPASHIANEVTLTLNGTRRRCDTLVYDKAGEPLMIVEYKAPTVAVTQAVFDQIVRYNMVLRASYLCVSNGLRHYFCAIDYTDGTYRFLTDVPRYSDLHRAQS